MVHGLYAEARRRFLELLDLDERTPGLDQAGSSPAGGRVEAIAAEDRALLLNGIGLFASRQGDYEEARARAEAAAAAWSALGDRPRVAESLGYVGLAAWLLGDSAEAVEQFEKSRRILQQCDRNPQTITFSAGIQRDLGLVARERRDYVRAAMAGQWCRSVQARAHNLPYRAGQHSGNPGRGRVRGRVVRGSRARSRGSHCLRAGTRSGVRRHRWRPSPKAQLISATNLAPVDEQAATPPLRQPGCN
jgi:tetratricopeptide (TPR) repeat protein